MSIFTLQAQRSDTFFQCRSGQLPPTPDPPCNIQSVEMFKENYKKEKKYEMKQNETAEGSERAVTVSKNSSLSFMPPITYIFSPIVKAPEYPLESFMGSPIIHEPTRGSNTSTVGTI